MLSGVWIAYLRFFFLNYKIGKIIFPNNIDNFYFIYFLRLFRVIGKYYSHESNNTFIPNALGYIYTIPQRLTVAGLAYIRSST